MDVTWEYFFFGHQHSWESGAEWQVNMDSYHAWCCLHDVTHCIYTTR